MWREMGIVNSYTMEATFCGSNLGTCEGYHFSTKEFELMGYHFCDTLLDYCDPDQTKVEYVLNQLTEDYRQAIVDKLQSLGVNVPDGVDPLDVEFDSDILSGVDSRYTSVYSHKLISMLVYTVCIGILYGLHVDQIIEHM